MDKNDIAQKLYEKLLILLLTKEKKYDNIKLPKGK